MFKRWLQSYFKDIMIKKGVTTQDTPANYSGFVVIGAGLSRTGTMSLQSALEGLLDGKCYHMTSIYYGNQTDLDHFNKALNGQTQKKDWIEFLKHRGYRAGLDAPIAMFYRELMDAFPNAKVILTTRNPRQWYESVNRVIIKMQWFTESWLSCMVLSLFGVFSTLKVVNQIQNLKLQGFEVGMCDAVRAGEREAAQFYAQWMAQVKSTVPPNKLLIYDVREGWKPLCQFLDLPIPDRPFPWLNDGVMVDKISADLIKLISGLFIGLVAIAGAFLAFAYFNVKFN